MAQTNKKTDNSYLQSKIDLRIAHLPAGDVAVLDCYAGTGKIWSGVEEQSGRTITVLPIDKRKDTRSFRLPGDNTRFLQSLDLTKYNVIDLDAYGIPFAQLRILFDRGYKGTVFVTFIQSLFGGIPHDLAVEVGFSETIAKKIPTLLGARGWSYMQQWLANQGVTKIHHMGHARNHYFSFIMP
jgi:hypothetical protein